MVEKKTQNLVIIQEDLNEVDPAAKSNDVDMNDVLVDDTCIKVQQE